MTYFETFKAYFNLQEHRKSSVSKCLIHLT